MAKTGYHHGDLQATILAAAADQIATEGVDSLSLRGLARRAEVSHAAPAHHFGDRAGLLTALAIDGFTLLATQFKAAAGDFREVAVAYITFALRHPGHFEVMFRRELLHADNPELAAARNRSAAALRTGVTALRPEDTPRHQRDAQLAAWSLVHGFASLWHEGALVDSSLADDAPESLARRMVATIDFR
ncbi:TetR/AcrR family transcriptional regulator [Nocardia crassostreae]|uniref:TetR/AcrR family transcriptional regulator n=1 Tax=Nocardia crassostreae TaxID=53428 RepID=UPI000833D7C0|nr:TetR/AcrR family transcriptional regulator [Nocardia crassostreae]